MALSAGHFYAILRLSVCYAASDEAGIILATSNAFVIIKRIDRKSDNIRRSRTRPREQYTVDHLLAWNSQDTVECTALRL